MLTVTLRRKLVVEVMRDGEKVPLKPREVNLVERLAMARPGEFVCTDMLIMAVYPDPDDEPEWVDALIPNLVNRLRNKGVNIEARWGWGYRLAT